MTTLLSAPAVLTPPADDEIDLRQVVAALRRQWSWILAGAVGGLGAAALATAVTKPVWEGSFQIVLASKEQQGSSRLANLAATNPMLANLAGLTVGGAGQLETEVKILESPSVLKPIFDLVKASRAGTGQSVSKLHFAEWVKNNLEVKLENGTSVLTIAYRDSDKPIVLQVLRQISEAYQRYSGRDRRDSISNGLAYVRQQVAEFRQKSEASTLAADAYRIRYGIAPGSRTIASGGSIDLSNLLSNSASTIGGGGLTSASTDTGPVSYQGDPLGQLAQINQELIRRQQTFTSRDPSIKALIRERDALRRYVESSSAGSLALPGQQPLSKDQAQAIVLRYQALERAAKRDTSTLDSLESTLLTLQLEQARATSPWDLISTPTLLEEPVSPRPARNLALGLLVGLVLGSGGALVADRRSGKVFSLEELQGLLQAPLLAALPPNPSEWGTTLQLIADGPLELTNSLALIPVGNSHGHCETIAQKLRPYLDHSTAITITIDWHQARNCQIQWLVATAGSSTRRDLQSLQQQLKLHTKPVDGLVWVQG
jgi:succinoglycan biosynthesis transport protein ExoP